MKQSRERFNPNLNPRFSARLSGESGPEIFHSDQGSRFTSQVFTGLPESAGVQMNMDGQGCCLDNVFVERLWRSVTYEGV